MSGTSPGLLRSAALAVAGAAMLGFAVVAGAYVGHYLDRRWGAGPWLTLSGAFLGLIMAVVQILSIMKRLDAGRQSKR